MGDFLAGIDKSKNKIVVEGPSYSLQTTTLSIFPWASKVELIIMLSCWHVTPLIHFLLRGDVILCRSSRTQKLVVNYVNRTQDYTHRHTYRYRYMYVCMYIYAYIFPILEEIVHLISLFNAFTCSYIYREMNQDVDSLPKTGLRL